MAFLFVWGVIEFAWATRECAMHQIDVSSEQFPDGLSSHNINDVMVELLESDDTLNLMNESALKNYFAEKILAKCAVKIDSVRLDRFDNEARSATVTFTGSTRKMRVFARIQRSGLRQPWERDDRQSIGETRILGSFG